MTSTRSGAIQRRHPLRRHESGRYHERSWRAELQLADRGAPPGAGAVADVATSAHGGRRRRHPRRPAAAVRVGAATVAVCDADEVLLPPWSRRLTGHRPQPRSATVLVEVLLARPPRGRGFGRRRLWAGVELPLCAIVIRSSAGSFCNWSGRSNGRRRAPRRRWVGHHSSCAGACSGTRPDLARFDV